MEEEEMAKMLQIMKKGFFSSSRVVRRARGKGCVFSK